MIIYTKDGKEHRISTGKPFRNTFFIDNLKTVIMRKDERAKPKMIAQQQTSANTSLLLLPPLPQTTNTATIRN
jgi:hypothetical protein